MLRRRLHFCPNVFLTRIHRLLFTHKGMSTFPSANNCQGQLQTPQSVPVLPSSIDVKNEWRYLYSPYMPSWCGQGQLLPLWYGNDSSDNMQFQYGIFPKSGGRRGVNFFRSGVFAMCSRIQPFLYCSKTEKTGFQSTME